MTVANKIKMFRKQKGLTQKQLGDLCEPKIGESTIRKYELGLLNPKIETLQKIAYALKIPINFLTFDFEDKLYNKENWPSSEEERKKISQEKYLIRTFNLLNNLGKEEALKRVEELVLVPKYVDEESPKNEDKKEED